MIKNVSFIQNPFEEKRKYFITTISFYYLATYSARKGGFHYFDDVSLILNIPDWEDFWGSRPRLPPAYKPIQFPKIYLNEEAIVSAVPWE